MEDSSRQSTALLCIWDAGNGDASKFPIVAAAVRAMSALSVLIVIGLRTSSWRVLAWRILVL